MHNEIDDQDIVQQGSPLHEYLKCEEVKDSLRHGDVDDGNDIGLHQLLQMKSHGNFSSGMKLDNLTRKNTAENPNMSMKEKMVQLFRIVNMKCNKLVLYRSYFPELNKFYQQQYAKALLDSKVLSEDDLDYICISNPSFILSTEKTFSKSESLLQELFTICIPVFFALLSILVALTNISMLYAQLPLIGLSVAILCQQAQFLHASSTWKKLNRRNLILLRSFLHSSDHLQNLIAKSIRLIQEMEVATMGYTIVTGGTPINRLERSRQKMRRECMHLRYMVLLSSCRAALHCRELTLRLLESFPSFQCNKNSKLGLYICQIPLEDLGPCFNENLNAEELAHVTDNFCLDVLKDTNRFRHHQCSELVRHLSCNISESMHDIKKNVFIREFFSILHPLHEEINESVKSLKQAYRAQLNLQHHSLDNHTRSKPNITRSRNQDHVAIHSLGMHLRAALNVTMQAEERFEGEDQDDLLLNEDFLQQIKIQLDASCRCWEECTKPNLPKTSEKPTERIGHVPISADYNLEEKCIDVSLLDKREEFTEDQIFEADTELDEFVDGNTLEKGDNLWTDVRKTQIEETVHVMKELQSVLHVKTSVEERELRKSKLFPEYTPKLRDTNSENKNVEMSSEYNQRTNSQTTRNVTGNEPDFFCTAYVPVDGSEQIFNKPHAEKPERGFFSADGNLPSLRTPKVPRRPAPPGKRKRKSRPTACVTENMNLVEEDKDPNEPSQGPISLGLGFSSLLANQAAKIAKANKTLLNGESLEFSDSADINDEAIFGDYDDLS